MTCLDKLILTTLTAQTFIIYLGVYKTKFYFKNERYIFFITLTISFLISSWISVFFIIKDIVNYDMYFYCEGTQEKILVDTIFNAIFLFLN